MRNTGKKNSANSSLYSTGRIKATNQPANISHLYEVGKIRDKETLTNLGKRVKHFRDLKGLSVYALAQEADIERSQLARIEKGATNPTTSTLMAIASALGVTLEDLFSNTTKEKH